MLCNYIGNWKEFRKDDIVCKDRKHDVEGKPGRGTPNNIDVNGRKMLPPDSISKIKME